MAGIEVAHMIRKVSYPPKIGHFGFQTSPPFEVSALGGKCKAFLEKRPLLITSDADKPF